MTLDAKIDTLLESQFAAGRLYAAISSRPGQSGRADGYILEGKELEVSVALYPVIRRILNNASSSTSGRSGQASRSTRTRHKLGGDVALLFSPGAVCGVRRRVYRTKLLLLCLSYALPLDDDFLYVRTVCNACPLSERD